MGYSTDFSGLILCEPALRPEHAAFLRQFAGTRRMKRDPELAMKLPDPIREAAGLPIGVDGGNFVGSEGVAGQDRDESVLAYNNPPSTQPGLWCQWVPSEDGTAIEWDGSEKFYHYTEWLDYLIDMYLKPWGYTLDGSVSWQGEDNNDIGVIAVKDNVISTRIGHVVSDEDREELDNSLFTSRQIDLIKYAITFAKLNLAAQIKLSMMMDLPEEWADKLQTNEDALDGELAELLTRLG